MRVDKERARELGWIYIQESTASVLLSVST
jgi:hypothetical protein